VDNHSHQVLSPDKTRPGRRSSLGLHASLVVTLAILGWIAVGPRPSLERPAVVAAPSPVAAVEAKPAPEPAIEPDPEPEPAPVAPPRKVEPDRAAIARAEAALDAATRERALNDARLADAEIALRKASLAATSDAAAGRALAYQVKDPSARIERAANRAAVARWEVKKLQTEVASLAQAPRTKAKPLMDQSAVAKPIEGKEFHFEVRRDRVAPVDIDKLTDLVKDDVRLHGRLGARGQTIRGVVGPVGAFSMKYEMGMVVSPAMADLLDLRESSYQLRGWEIVPDHEDRGESYETAWQPAAAFSRTINRLSPSTSTITLWIYPDGFPLYRRLRDDLHARGFLVAARPLPDGMTVRGSPAGSLSAGQ
jgi:hypothetical protein